MFQNKEKEESEEVATDDEMLDDDATATKDGDNKKETEGTT